MKTKKHPKDMTETEAAAVVAAFDDADDYGVAEADILAELRAAAAPHGEKPKDESKPPPWAPTGPGCRGASSAPNWA